MEITISKKDLLRVVGRAHAVAKDKSGMPILNNILLEAGANGRLHCSATDLYKAVRSSTECKVKTPGSVALSARTLFDIVKNLPEGEVKLVVDDKHHGQLRCGKIKFRVPGMPGEDFPPLPEPPEGAQFQELESVTIKQLIGLTSYAMSNDDTRPHLSGLLFENDGKVARAVATDGHRLSLASFPSDKPWEKGFLLPSGGVAELKRLVDDDKDKGPVGILTAGGNAFFRVPGLLLSVKLADEQFPPYSKVIPGSHLRRVVVARNLLLDSLKRIGLVAADKSNSVRLVVETGKLDVQSENADVGEGSEELSVDFSGPKLAIGVNVRYLMDAVSALPDDEIALEFGGELDPIVVKPATEDARFTGVIMPMRI